MVMENLGKKTFLESHRKVMENLLKIGSHKILLRAEKNFFKVNITISSNLANTIW